jgi:TetR/AcrR family transcriptional regulator
MPQFPKRHQKELLPLPNPPRISNATRNQKSRAAILDAAQLIMREEGYAAVSSRKIATRAGLKSQLVHYYFKTMDELFLALFHNVEERFFLRLSQATASKRPLRAIWTLCRDSNGPRLTKEFVAMATHHEMLRTEIGRSAERTRAILIAQITRALSDNDIAQQTWPAPALAVLMDGTARLLVADELLGASLGNTETIAFIEGHITRLEAGAAVHKN